VVVRGGRRSGGDRRRDRGHRADGRRPPGVGLELLMPDYPARMAGLTSNVEAGHISLLLAVVRKEGTPAIAADQQSAGGRR
jgi:hypothetical protein